MPYTKSVHIIMNKFIATPSQITPYHSMPFQPITCFSIVWRRLLCDVLLVVEPGRATSVDEYGS